MSETAPFFIFRQSEGTTSVSVVYLEVLLIMIIWQEKFIDYWLWPYPLPCLDFRLCSLFCSPLLLPPHYIFFSCTCASCSCCPVSVPSSKLHKYVKCLWLAKKQKTKINESKQSGLSLTHSNIREHLKNFLICLMIFAVTVMHSNPALC